MSSFTIERHPLLRTRLSHLKSFLGAEVNLSSTWQTDAPTSIQPSLLPASPVSYREREPHRGSLILLIKWGPKALVTVHLFPHALYQTHGFHLRQHVQMSWICHVQFSVRILISLSSGEPDNRASVAPSWWRENCMDCTPVACYRLSYWPLSMLGYLLLNIFCYHEGWMFFLLGTD